MRIYLSNIPTYLSVVTDSAHITGYNYILWFTYLLVKSRPNLFLSLSFLLILIPLSVFSFCLLRLASSKHVVWNSRCGCDINAEIAGCAPNNQRPLGHSWNLQNYIIIITTIWCKVLCIVDIVFVVIAKG